MLMKSLYFLLLIFFSFSFSSIIFVFTITYSYDNIDLSQKNKTPIDHVVVISQGRRSFDNYFGTYEESNGFPKNLSIPVNPFQFSPSFQNFTISLTFKSNISNAGKESFIINKGGIGKESPGNNLNFGIWLDEKEHLTAGFESKNGKDFFVVSQNRYTDNKWHHVLLTYNQSVLKLFVDKNLQAEKNTQGNIPDDNNLPFIRLGANFLKQNNFYVGNIDNVVLWNRSLNENEISSFFSTRDIPEGSIVDIRLSTTNIQYSKNFPLKFKGNNYFDLKLIPNITAGLIEPFHLKNTKTPNIKYGPVVYEKSYNYGFMDGFIFAQNDNKVKSTDNRKKDNSTIVMGFYNNSEIGPYWYLASQFVLADNFFSATRQTDLTNNLHLFTSEEGNFKKYVPSTGLSINSTVLDLLEKKNIPWKIYVENYDSNQNYSNDNESSKRFLTLNPILGIPRFVDNTTLNGKIQDLSNYFHDLKHNFPSVSYIILPDSQESSPKDILKGQESVVSLIISLMKSKYWKNSLFILTYSGSGGWYDHVPPPLNFTNSELGFRVPTLFISPFSHEGIVDSTLYDTLSILKFIKYNFNLKSINYRESLSNNLLSAFDFDKPPRNSNETVAKLLENYQTTITKNKPMLKENIFFMFYIYLIVLVVIILFYVILRFIIKK